MNVRLRQWLILYQYVAGFSDTATGLLLVGFPGFTFHLMGLTVFPQPAFVRYIGVFVLCVGLSYLWAAIRWPLNELGVMVWVTQWKITALMRGMVALFLIWQWMVQGVEAHWASVIVFDGAFAAFQIIGIEQGWIERAV
ncbi:MAG TPA: hypothetical protein VGL00_13765 [Terracidiphilus sp.]